MLQVIHNPVDGIYAATPDYVHALEVRRPERRVVRLGRGSLDYRG